VRCFRDEDPRADRQAEFTQIDVEMSFVQSEEVMRMNEVIIARVFKEILGVEVSLPIKQMTYAQAIDEYGIDRPDLRFEMKLRILPILPRPVHSGLCQYRQKGGIVRACASRWGRKYSRSDIEVDLQALWRTRGKGYVV
jgi:aspartyl-tRNA synthetase